MQMILSLSALERISQGEWEELLWWFFVTERLVRTQTNRFHSCSTKKFPDVPAKHGFSFLKWKRLYVECEVVISQYVFEIWWSPISSHQNQHTRSPIRPPLRAEKEKLPLNFREIYWERSMVSFYFGKLIYKTQHRSFTTKF